MAHGVFERDGDSYRLSEDFAVLASPDAVQSLPDVLNKELVLERALESAGYYQARGYS